MKKRFKKNQLAVGNTIVINPRLLFKKSELSDNSQLFKKYEAEILKIFPHKTEAKNLLVLKDIKSGEIKYAGEGLVEKIIS
ncbi:hypothetical protein KAI52_02050 [Candidatus Parcubacteria bacterium]|nr:hypothetical protein [Candidatus Parcubacteria bacterium]